MPTNQSVSLPESDPILHGLLILAFLIHALFMNLVVGGTLVTVMTDAIGLVTGRNSYRQLAATLANWLPGFLGIAVVLGILPLVFVQILYGPVFSTAANYLSELWVVAVAAVVVGYGGLYAYKNWHDSLNDRPGLCLSLGTLSAMMFLSVALVFVMVSVLMLHPDQLINFKQGGFLSVLTLPSLIPRYGHLVLAAVAGMGMFLVCYGLFLGLSVQASTADEPKEQYATWVTRYGVAWTLAGTLPQIVVGPWLLLSLPDVVRADLVSGQNVGSLAFFAGLTTGLLSLVLLNAALMAPHVRGLALGGVLSLVATVCCMVMVRHAVRMSWLSQHDAAAALPIQDQWTILSIFGIMVLIVFGLTVFMVRGYKKTRLVQ